MAKPGGHQDAAYLAEAVKEHGVTVLQMVPSLLTVMLKSKLLRESTTLR